MRQKVRRSPEEMRAFVAQEIEEIKTEIERLRVTAEARLDEDFPTPQRRGAVGSPTTQYRRTSFIME